MEQNRRATAKAGKWKPRFLWVFIVWFSLSSGEVWAGVVPVVDVSTNLVEAAGIIADAVNWKANLALLGDMLLAVVALDAVMVAGFSKIVSTLTKATAVDASGQRAYLETRVKMTQALADSSTEDSLLKAGMRARAKNVPSDGKELVNIIVMHQAAMTTEAFRQSVAKIAASAIEAAYRGKASDGSGPEYAKDNYILRCEAGLGNPIDYPEDCVNKTLKGADGRPYYDSDLSFSILTGGQTLEFPAFEDVTIDGATYKRPNPQNDAQRFWVAGLYYCYNLAGPRPTPPRDNSPSTIVSRAQWNHCAARQSHLIRPCVELLAYHTRPNSSQTELFGRVW